MDLHARVDAIDRTTLTPVTRRALRREMAVVTEWHRVSLSGGSTGASIFRYSGRAQDAGVTLPWSLVLKLVPSQISDEHALGSSDDPSDWLYWKRELLLRRSGLLENLSPSLVAPQCYGIGEWPDGYWLWLEELHDDVGGPWSLERFSLAARHFGQFNGMYLTQHSLPDYPWLARQVPRAMQRTLNSPWDCLPALLDHALVRRGLPGAVANGMLRLWAQRDLYFAALDRLPKTLQHGDAGRKNLRTRFGKEGQEITSALDWGLVSIGAVGEELAALVVSTVLWYGGVEPEQLSALDARAFAGYLQGLRDVGWRGDPRLPRLGYCSAVVLRYGGVLLETAVALDETQRDRWEHIIGRSMDEIADHWAKVRRFILTLADEARQLIQQLPREELETRF